MGGCCGTCRASRMHVTPINYYCPQAEELQSLTSHDGAAGFQGNLVDTNSSVWSLDTYHQPPMPMLFGEDLGSPQSTQMSGSSLQEAGGANRMELDCKAQEGIGIASLGNPDLELLQLSGANVEEDVCPTCFEEYTEENPKIITKCNHHFHLSCIYDWLERSDTCPMCNQEMDFEV